MNTCARCNQARARYEAVGNAADHWCLCTGCHDLLRADFAFDNYRKLGSGPPICVFHGKSEFKYMIRNREGLLTELSFNPPVIVTEIQIGNLLKATTKATYDWMHPNSNSSIDLDVLPYFEVLRLRPPKGYTVLDGAIIFVTIDRETEITATLDPIPGV